MMKANIISLILIFFFAACQSEKTVDVEFILLNFKEHADRIQKLEFKTKRIDSFEQHDVVVNNSGHALIEKDWSDTNFGFSFYGKRDDVPTEYIYDKHMGYEYSKTDSTYKSYYTEYGFLGSPGGQMIPINIFELDTVYKSLTVSETDSLYILLYTYDDDTTYEVTDRTKTIELLKRNFFPIKVKQSSKKLGYKTSLQSTISDIRINDQVNNSIKKYRNEFNGFQLIDEEQRESANLLGNELPEISLPNLQDRIKHTLDIDKPTLIDFWEVWCGPCVASLPKVEELKTKYSAEVDIIGIVSEDEESAKKLLVQKGISYTNLIGDDTTKKIFGVNSWPRYFLIDKTGIVRNEYFGFSEQIELDISMMLRK